MAEQILQRIQTIERPIAEVFDFFADAGNLERITPAALNFKIVTPQPIRLAEGTLIDYELRLRGIPFKWRTEITEWNPPFNFVDSQLRGPYRQWIHKHTFEELEPGVTRIGDEVRYRLPLEPFGDLVHFIVKRELKEIFDHRQRTVAELLAA
ncbi:MAG TPA: SRPBCC family protein [Pyrinomonadaceae bacterium]|nr:SRPBCC family protein [Pyrinomonadaceae bacterium]